MISKIFIFITYCLIWFALVGIELTTQSIIFALGASAVTFYLSNKLELLDFKNKLYISKFIGYSFWLLKEIFNSALQVSLMAWHRHIFIQPILKPIKSIQKSDFGIVLYANSITLTPGTVTVGQEGNDLLVHALDISFMDDLQKGAMDNRIYKILKMD